MKVEGYKCISKFLLEIMVSKKASSSSIILEVLCKYKHLFLVLLGKSLKIQLLRDFFETFFENQELDS